MAQGNRKDIVRSQFNRQAQNFSRWSVTKMSPIIRYYVYYSSILRAEPVRFRHYYPRVSVSSTPSW